MSLILDGDMQIRSNRCLRDAEVISRQKAVHPFAESIAEFVQLVAFVFSHI
jgi:hypothetical protein